MQVFPGLIFLLLVAYFLFAKKEREQEQAKKVVKIVLPIFADNEEDFEDEVKGPPWEKACPARRNPAACPGDYARAGDRRSCPTYLCRACGKWQPWCFGGSDDPRCDDCIYNENHGDLA